MSRYLLCLLLVSQIPSAKSPPHDGKGRLMTVDDSFAGTVAKAERDYRLTTAAAAKQRLKDYNELLADAVRMDQRETAIALKARIKHLEGLAPGRPSKPDFTSGPSEYYVRTDSSTWEVARQRCESMGGDLAMLERPGEEQLVLAQLRARKLTVWLGATDADEEGSWRWLDGRRVKTKPRVLENAGAHADHLLYWHRDAKDKNAGRLADGFEGFRLPYLCECDRENPVAPRSVKPAGPKQVGESEASYVERSYAEREADAQSELIQARAHAADERIEEYRRAKDAAQEAGDFETWDYIVTSLERFEGSRRRPERPPADFAFGNSRYALVRTPLPWHRAVRECLAMGGQLAVLNEPGEAQFVLNELIKRGVDCWVGATDEVQEGTWLWTDGTAAHPPHQDHIGDEHYMHFYMADRNWNDGCGRSELFYVIEWKE